MVLTSFIYLAPFVLTALAAPVPRDVPETFVLPPPGPDGPGELFY